MIPHPALGWFPVLRWCRNAGGLVLRAPVRLTIIALAWTATGYVMTYVSYPFLGVPLTSMLGLVLQLYFYTEFLLAAHHVRTGARPPAQPMNILRAACVPLALNWAFLVVYYTVFVGVPVVPEMNAEHWARAYDHASDMSAEMVSVVAQRSVISWATDPMLLLPLLPLYWPLVVLHGERPKEALLQTVRATLQVGWPILIIDWALLVVIYYGVTLTLPFVMFPNVPVSGRFLLSLEVTLLLPALWYEASRHIISVTRPALQC